MESLPSLFDLITSKDMFKEKFAFIKKSKSEWIALLIQTFGSNNALALSELLGEEIRILYNHELARQDVLQQICFECLFKKIPLTPKLLKGVYAQNFLLDGKLLQERIDRDTKDFLSANNTPQQTAKFLKLYCITWVKELVDNIQEQRIAATNKLSGTIFYPNNKDEGLLYKYSALVWFGKSISHAEMFFAWHRDKKDAYFKTDSLYFKLFLDGKKVEPLIPPEGPFPHHKIEVTLFTFFDHAESCLPEKKLMERVTKKLSLLFSNEQAREDAYCYINKLHGLFNKKTKEFDFDQALFALKSLQLDENGKLYHFLHTLLHYFRFLSVLSDHKALRIIFFYSLYKYPCQQLQKWNLPIQGKTPMQTFEVDITTCRFIKKHFELPHQWARVFYNFMELKGKYEFNLKDHIELARIMEEFILEEPLPMKLLICFLEHLPAKKSLAEVLKLFIDLKEKNAGIEYSWKDLRNKFMDAFSGLDEDPLLLKTMEQLAFTLQYAVQRGFNSSFRCRKFKKIDPISYEIQYEDRNKGDTDCQDYVRYLCDLPLVKSLFLLDALILDQSSPNYNILHAHLHAVNVSNDIRHDNYEEILSLFHEILAVPLEKRKTYDHRIVEKNVLRLSVRYDQLKELFEKRQDIPPEELGEIWLQIVQTQSKGITSTCPSFLNVTQLGKLVQVMEMILKMPIPPECFINLFFFRLVKGGIFSILEQFIDAPLQQIAELKEKFIQEFEDPSLIFEFESERQARYMENIADLAEFLALACCPSSALRSMSMVANDTSFKAVHPKLPLGPLKMTLRIPDPESDNWNFTVILKKGEVSCFFLHPIRMPKEEKERNLHFELIEDAIGEFAQAERLIRIFDPFIKTIMDNFSKGYNHLFNPKGTPLTTLLQEENRIVVRTKYFEGTIEKKWHREKLKNLTKSSKGFFSFSFTPLKGQSMSQEFNIEWKSEGEKVQVTLNTVPHHNSLFMEYPLFNTDEEWVDAILYQATLLFLIAIELAPARLIQGIEEVLMMKLPSWIIDEVLSFQLKKSNSEMLLSILKEFIEIQSAVKTHDFSYLIQPTLFQELKELKEKLVQHFDIPCKALLADLLERACCPPSLLASTSIHQQNPDLFVPLLPELPLGPLKLTCWFPDPDPDGEDWSYSMILKKEKVTCFFHIPFNLPIDDEERFTHLEGLDHCIKKIGNESKDMYGRFANTLKDYLSKGYYYLFGHGEEVPFGTITQTKEGFSCTFKGVPLKVKKGEHSKQLKTLKNTPKGLFAFNFWSLKGTEEARTTEQIYIEWHEEHDHCRITLSISQNKQTIRNSLTLVHPLFNTDEEWVDGVLYQAALLYFQCKELGTLIPKVKSQNIRPFPLKKFNSKTSS